MNWLKAVGNLGLSGVKLWTGQEYNSESDSVN